MIEILIAIALFIWGYIAGKSIKKYLYYLKLLKKYDLSDLSVEEEIWIYCYKYWFKILNINGYFYIGRWMDSYYCGHDGFWWKNKEFKMEHGKHDSLIDVLKTLQKNFSTAADKKIVVISSSIMPKQ